MDWTGANGQVLARLDKLLCSDFCPRVWGSAIGLQIVTLKRMMEMSTLGRFDVSFRTETEYPLLTKLDERMCLDKPLQVGSGWPTLVKGKLVLVVPDGGQCFICKSDVSGKVAKYSYKNEEFTLSGYEAVVFSEVKDNVSCGDRDCAVKTMEIVEKMRPKWGKAELEEQKKFLKYSKTCDQCLKFSLNTHRCYSCLSSQYCSEECRVNDLDWHKTVCETWAKDDRKKMPDRKEQKKELKKWSKSAFKFCKM